MSVLKMTNISGQTYHILGYLVKTRLNISKSVDIALKTHSLTTSKLIQDIRILFILVNSIKNKSGLHLVQLPLDLENQLLFSFVDSRNV